jgi:hypothetical protein
MDSGSNSTTVVFVVIVIIIVIVFSTMSSTAINYPLLSYILAVVIVLMTTVSYLYRSERLVAAISIFILFMLIFTFFGLRWFKHGLSSTSVYKGNYPPVINTCPDYMSVYRNGTTVGCIDTIGILRNGSGMSTIRRGEIPADKDIFKHIYTPTSDKDDLKKKAEDKSLTWEGITDGLYEKWT